MADSRGFDAILGVSKKLIKHADESDNSDQAKDKISSAISRLKEKSQELSDRKVDTFEDFSSEKTDNKPLETNDLDSDMSNDPADDLEKVEAEDTKVEHVQSDYINHLMSEIEFLKQQLEVKDNQIETKDQQLNKKDDLILNFQVLLKSEQDKVLRLESKMMEEHEVSEGVKTAEAENKETPARENESWFVKIFGRRTR